MADGVNNAETQQQLNKLLAQRKKILRDQTNLLREQVGLTNQLTEALGGAGIREDVLYKTRELNRGLDQASEAAKSFSRQSQDMAELTVDALDETDDGFEGLLDTYAKATGKAGKWGAATGGFIEGIGDGVRLLRTGLKGVLDLSGAVVMGMFSVGKAIASIPFKIFNAFINEANRLQGEPLLAREFEETRKSFGDFGEDLSKHVVQSYRNFRGELAETGLTVYRVLGYRHERLKFAREMFEALEATAHRFGAEIAQQAEYFVAYQKGLGLSGEQMKGLAQATMGTGETFEETLRTTTNFTTSLGKQFGISQKVIGRDVGEMSKDLKTFGSVGVRQMAQLSVYARQLGADFKALLGIVDRFDNFEDAAESAARLAQAFGLNIDAMKMMREQDPGKRIDMLRKAFARTGKDITKLSRQERNYLATTAGIEDQALNAVFALENQGKTYEEIASAGQTAEQQQITQAEAMEKLSDSIERMIKSGRRTGGFFDRFVMGFKRGMRYAGDFHQTMRNIKRSLWAAEREGRRVGRAFVNHFPGMKQFISAVKDFFDPKKFSKMAHKVSKAFNDFFEDLGDPKKAKDAFKNLLKALQKAFFGLGASQKDAMENMLGGLKKAFKAVGRIILSGVKIAMKNIAKFFKAITKVIKGDTTLIDAFKEQFGKAGEKGMNSLLDIWYEISKELGPVGKELWSATKDLLGTLWDKIVEWWDGIDWEKVFQKVKKPLIGALGVLFGPAVIKGIASGLGEALVSGIGDVIKGGGLQKMFKKRGLSLGAAGGAAFAITAAIGINKGLKDFEGKMEGNFGRTERKMGAGAAGIIDALTFGLLPDDLAVKLAESIATLSGDLFKAIEDKFGPTFSNKLKGIISESIDVLGSFGEVISKVFSGDKAGLKQASKDLGKKLFKFLKTSIRFAITQLPGVIAQTIVDFGSFVGEKTFSVLSGAFEGLAEEFEDVPILGWLFSSMSKLFDKISGLFEKFPGVFKKIVRKIAEWKEDVVDLATAAWEGWKKLFNKETWLDMGQNIIEGIKEALTNLKDTIKQPFVDAYDEITDYFEISSPSKLFAKFGENLMSGFERGVETNSPDKLFVGQAKAIVENINKEIASINEVNLKPKMRNLGKALGIQGMENLRIEHENFKVDINVQVELDPTKLADAVVDTGKVAKSVRTMRK